MPELPRYVPSHKCHREIQALRIASVEAAPGGTALLHMEEPYLPIIVTAEWLAQQQPEAGGYYVIYRNDVTAYLNARIFREKFTLVSDPA